MRRIFLSFIASLLIANHASVFGQPAQPQDPRIRIRVMDEDGVIDASRSELSNTVYIDEIGSTAKSQLDRIDRLLEKGQYPEAVDMLMRVLEGDLSKLAVMESRSNALSGFARYEPVSQRVFQIVHRLAEESSAAFVDYQSQTDPLAKRWYEEAKASRDEKPLHRILHETPLSRYGIPALQLLGDISLEREHFGAARRYYRRMSRLLAWHHSKHDLPFWVRAKRGELLSAIIDPISESETNRRAGTPELGPIWARLVLASILEANRERATTELAMLKRAWPNARGKIGGIEGTYVDALSKLLRNSRNWASNGSEEASWPTFAGNESRNRICDLEIDIPIRPAWRTPLAKLAAADRAIERQYDLPIEPAGELPDRPCGYFPIVVNDWVLIKEETRLRALDVHTGKSTWSSRDDGQFFENTDYVRPATVTFGQQANIRLGQLRFLMSSAEGLSVATFGARQGVGQARDSALVGFDLRRQGAIQFGPILAESAQWSFQSAPLNDANRCWVGRRLTENTTQDFLTCYDVDSGEELWQTRICSAEALGQGSVESTSNFVLTKHEDTIYVSTHLGTVTAVFAETGEIRWMAKYPRRGPKRRNLSDQNWHATRDLTPCLIHDDLVITAPSDTNRVLAFHQDDGTLIWSTSVPSDATQLVGVGKDDHLIVSGRRVWWLDVYTGRLSSNVDVNPFPADATGEPKGVGRGLLSAGNVYWPAVEEEESKIYVLDQATGKPVRQPIDLSAADVEAGNLMLTSKHLLIASPTQLVAYELAD